MKRSRLSTRVPYIKTKPPELGSDSEKIGLDEMLCSLDQKPNMMLPVDDYIGISLHCRKLRNLGYAKQLFAHIQGKGLETHQALGNHLVPMFVECGSIADAKQVFDGLKNKNVHSCTSLISGYVESNQPQHAWNLYVEMQDNQTSPNSYTLVALLKSCDNLEEVQVIHFEVTDKGFERDIFLGSSLVDAYAKSKALSDARNVFERLPVLNVVSWTALIGGYVESGFAKEALECYEEMKLQGLSSNDVTFICLLKACAKLRDLRNGQELHAEIVNQGFLSEAFIGSSLVDMYAKCGCLQDAQQVFDKLPVQDVVSWNALIAGYVEHGPGQEVLSCFERMQRKAVAHDAFTVVCVVKACGNTGAIDKGMDAHSDIIMKSFETDAYIGNVLVDMYAKCGSLIEAQNVFDKLEVRDIVSWNALIKGYATNHQGDIAIKIFESMKEQSITPDGITFTAVLSACSHTNMVDKGQEYFKLMTRDYRITPEVDHFTCLIDLLARSGHLMEIEKFLETASGPGCKNMWLALLSACKRCSEVDLAYRCFQQVTQLDPVCSTPYLLMANIFATAGRQDEAYMIEDLRNAIK